MIIIDRNGGVMGGYGLQINAVTGTLWAKEIMHQQYQKQQEGGGASSHDNSDKLEVQDTILVFNL